MVAPAGFTQGPPAEGDMRVGILTSGGDCPGLNAVIRAAVLTGMVYQALPYTVLVLYPALARLDPSLTEAARSMGAAQHAPPVTCRRGLRAGGVSRR